MKFRFLCVLGFYLISWSVNCQFSTDFSEGHLDLWQGDTSDFIINAEEQLQLNAPEGSSASWLYAPLTFSDSMVWELYCRLDFAPSTSNQLKIFLGVDAEELATASGYYLEIGASGNEDPLELKYLNNGVGESLAASAPGLVADDPVELNLRIIRKESGLWEVYQVMDLTAELLFSTTHDTSPLSSLSFFGFDCKYTSTRRDKFFFDDISIEELQPDVTPPSCLSLNLLDANSVELTFDELLDESTALSPANFILQPGDKNPDEVVLNQPNITLSWDDDFISQQAYTLSIEGVEDQSGNTILPVEKAFTYVHIAKASPNAILITEIMADPTPAIGLPQEEYIEIYNTTDNVFQLSDYTLQIGSGTRALPDVVFAPKSYMIICDEEFTEAFESFGATTGIAGFPTVSNAGASILLSDEDGTIIHQVDYTSSWYGDPDKSDGGWSLEMINPMLLCSGMTNWQASLHLSGGTPGQENSLWEQQPDDTGPELISVFSRNDQSILLQFDEKLDPILMESTSAYSIDPQIEINSALLNGPNAIELILSTPMAEGVAYRLNTFDAFDCLGNVSTITDTTAFGVTSVVIPGDVLINEILFNPVSNGSRFIEIINVSDKFIDLNDLAIGRISDSGNDLYGLDVNQVLNPGAIAVFSPVPSDIMARYTVPYPQHLFASALPSWDSDTDNASIVSAGQVIDSFTYSSAWHLPVLADQNGVSLERISTKAPSDLSSTWHSASSVSGYGTPTGINSQITTSSEDAEAPYTITNSVFSPDEDGYNDFLALNFLLDSGDFLGSVWVYDLESREIIQLLSNESLSPNTIIQWDGRNRDQVLADAGIYVLYIQLWDAEGEVKNYKETCALVKR